MALLKWIWVNILVLGLLLHAQSDLLQKKAELMEEIRRIRKEISEEKESFKSYRQQKENTIDYKTEENQSLQKDIRHKLSEIRSERRRLVQVERETLSLERDTTLINQKIRDLAVDMSKDIDMGIPFEKEKRKAVLSSLIYDIDNNSVSANESLTRFLSFLNAELAMAYDSQVIRTTIEIGGSIKDVDSIRIGRVFFAIDDGREVYLWNLRNGEYILSSDSLSSLEARELRNASEIIQGKRVPDLVILPIPTSTIQKN